MDVYLLGLAIGLGYHCYTDVRYMLLYDNTNIVLAVLALLRAWQLDCLKASWQGAVVLGGIMLIIYYASHGGMGEGDVKLAAVLGTAVLAARFCQRCTLWRAAAYLAVPK